MIRDTVERIAKDHREGILYVFFGGFTTLISLASYSLFEYFLSDQNLSYVLSWICGVTFAFITNKWFVFESKNLERTTLARETSSFYAGRLIVGLMALAMFSLINKNWPDQVLFGIRYLPSRTFTAGIEIILNWIISKYLIFNRKDKRS